MKKLSNDKQSDFSINLGNHKFIPDLEALNITGLFVSPTKRKMINKSFLLVNHNLQEFIFLESESFEGGIKIKLPPVFLVTQLSQSEIGK